MPVSFIEALPDTPVVPELWFGSKLFSDVFFNRLAAFQLIPTSSIQRRRQGAAQRHVRVAKHRGVNLPEGGPPIRWPLRRARHR